jgi:hypothetical protein
MKSILDLLGKKPADIGVFFNLRNIGSPEKKPVGEPRYIELFEHGISFVLDENHIVECIQLCSKNYGENYEEYRGQIYSKLTFGSSRNEVRTICGSPYKWKDGGPGMGLFGGYLKPWDAFVIEGYRYHFEYSKTAQCIDLISISIPEDN